MRDRTQQRADRRAWRPAHHSLWQNEAPHRPRATRERVSFLELDDHGRGVRRWSLIEQTQVTLEELEAGKRYSIDTHSTQPLT